MVTYGNQTLLLRPAWKYGNKKISWWPHDLELLADNIEAFRLYLNTFNALFLGKGYTEMVRILVPISLPLLDDIKYHTQPDRRMKKKYAKSLVDYFKKARENL